MVPLVERTKMKKLLFLAFVFPAAAIAIVSTSSPEKPTIPKMANCLDLLKEYPQCFEKPMAIYCVNNADTELVFVTPGDVTSMLEATITGKGLYPLKPKTQCQFKLLGPVLDVTYWTIRRPT